MTPIFSPLFPADGRLFRVPSPIGPIGLIGWLTDGVMD
jgi:hypothetical protein